VHFNRQFVPATTIIPWSEVIIMTSVVLLILIAVIGGVAVTLQGQFMGLMDQGIATRE
jgi:hypothetical protein